MVFGLKKRKESDVIDFVELQKRGLIDAIKRQRSETRIPISAEGIVDFSSGSNSSSSSGSSSGSSGSASSFLNFLDSGSSGESEKSAVDFWGNPVASAKKSSDNSGELKIKIEELEYKLERAIERIEKLEMSGTS